jgi:hypothetical protein
MLDLAERKNAMIKVSGACTLSREPYLFPDIWDPLARVFDAWGFGRCVWALTAHAHTRSSTTSRPSNPFSTLSAWTK